MAQFSDMEENYLLLPIFLLLPLLYFFLKQFKSSSASNLPTLPPGPTPWPILGNIPHMGKMPHVSLANFAQTYGPLISLRLGTQYMVVGSSPAVAIEILKTHDRILSARYVPNTVPGEQEELNRTSIVWNGDCNNRWKYLRTLCKGELFSVKALNDQSCLREKKILDMIEHLHAKEGEIVYIGDLVFTTVFNMLSNMLVSKDIIALDEKMEDGGVKSTVRSILEMITAPNLSDFYPILSKLDLQGLRRETLNLTNKFRSLWELILEERQKGALLSQRDFLDFLLENNVSNEGIQRLILELFTGGAETTATTIEWTIAELVKNPESMKKVQEELDREINQEWPKESHLSQLPYLNACIKETFRLHTPAPLLLPHRAPKTYQVMNYTIPKGAQIFVNIWAIGRDPSIWDDPLKFKPERFLNCDLDYKGNDFEFLPFGAGRRICPGLPLAARNVALVVASLIHCFDWSLPHGKDPQQLDMKEKFGFTLHKEQPLVLIHKIRKFN